MTREELKAHCIKQIEMCEFWAIGRGEKPNGKVYEEHKLILELLEQEPCEDAISRQAVLDINEHHHGQMPNHVNHEIWEEIKALPPVTPQSKTGHWIELGCVGNGNYDFECSECHHTDTHSKTVKVNYCWCCGIKMEAEE